MKGPEWSEGGGLGGVERRESIVRGGRVSWRWGEVEVERRMVEKSGERCAERRGIGVSTRDAEETKKLIWRGVEVKTRGEGARSEGGRYAELKRGGWAEDERESAGGGRTTEEAGAYLQSIVQDPRSKGGRSRAKEVGGREEERMVSAASTTSSRRHGATYRPLQ